MNRREFFKTVGVVAGGVLGVDRARASTATDSTSVPDGNLAAVLVDTTRCVGCRTCEATCSETWGPEHGFPVADVNAELDISDKVRQPIEELCGELLSANGREPQQVTLSFTIGEQGDVRDLQLPHSTLGPELGRWVAERVGALRFDKRESPLAVQLRFAFERGGVVEQRETSEDRWTLVTQHRTSAGEVTVKRQCMHCLQPACSAACLTKAMLKTEEGPVVWRESKCMGCRFCMVSCPFDGPKFEYDSAVPKIQKCRFCWERLVKGQPPACVEACPAEALTFGTRAEMLDTARQRIAEQPNDYVHHIYGEQEAGGTSWLYLSKVPFTEIGLRTDLGTVAYPSYPREFLYAVPAVLTVVPPLLLAISRAHASKEESAETEGGE